MSLKKTRTWKLEPAKIQSILVSFGFILFFVLVLVILVFAGQRYFAQVRYSQGLRAVAWGDTERGIIDISRATQLDPLTDIYWRELSQAAILQLSQEMVREDLTQEELLQRTQVLFSLAINSVTRATDVSPNNVANWQVRGFTYRSLIGLVEGSFDWALKSYQRAKELEPVSPLIPLEISRTYLAQANLARQLEREEESVEKLKKAQEYLQKAISLKPDFWPAHFQQAIVFEAQGKLGEAIAKLEEIKPFNLEDIALAFQLGGYYWRKEDLDRAKREFERAISLSPDFNNARFFLGLIHDRQGEREKAINQFEIIAAFSEENRRQVAEILENLKAGRPALDEEAEALPGIGEEIPILEQPEEALD
jgi:tetratricopeptide (TPR) repeat protein